MSLIKNKKTGRIMSTLLSLAMVATALPSNLTLTTVKADDNTTPYVVSLGRPVYTSSEVGNNTGDKVVDGDLSTRWEGAASDPQWLYVDLGKETNISSVYLKWEAAYAKSYKLQVSNDEENWTDVFIRGNAGDDSDANQDISISYSITSEGYVSASWTSIDNAKYKVCVDDENTIAKAPDGYSFSGHSVNNGLINLAEGTYTLIVIALDSTTGAEKARGTKTINVSSETVTEAEQETTTSLINDSEATIDFPDTTARYVRLYMTERGTNYGYSLYEFQVYGLDGLVKRPVDYGTNLAKNATVTCSSMRDVWWMYKDGVLDQSTVAAENAVDGDESTYFTSGESNNQWITVDLGETKEIGRVIIKWTGDAGKIYDIDVSNNGTDWEHAYRRLDGYANLTDNVEMYANARYVRVYGYSRVENGSGFGIYELEVYGYKTGDAKVKNTISELPSTIIKTVGSGTYITNDRYLETAKLPTYIDTDNISTPVYSNDWWQSCMIKQFGNTMSTLPFKTGYSKKGLSVLTVTDGWVPTPGETDVNISVQSESTPDFYVLPENVDTSTAYDRLHANSDYAAELQLMDDDGVVMTSTHVKGSPYIYCDFGSREKVYISIPNLTGIFDDNGNSILASGTSITTDHIGIQVTDSDNENKTATSVSYYGFNFPAGTVIKNTNGTLKITLPGTDRYMSIAALLKKSDLNTYYQHGYAFVTDTAVTYTYNDAMSQITSHYTVTTELKRSGFSNVTMQLMLPHQWKYSAQASSKVGVYPSVRGDMYAVWNNTFTTVDTFEGLLPDFAMPTNDEFDHDKIMQYLKTLDTATANLSPAADAYWEGKNIHPLGMGVLMADQLGETELRDEFLSRLKARLVDWFTYSGTDDTSYFIYDEHWGTLYYWASEFGANTGICDHHFTYGYFMFGCAVLATYDEEFYNNYKDMIEMLMRDYANPSADDDMFCRFRAYDLYEGHSWAGGYADNDNGNNQESASESLFSWVGMYLWGVLTGDDTWRDAGVFGFSNEMEAVEQYWFDYDEQNWLDDWPYDVVAQVYGSQNFFGTFFGGQPLYCYGIQWLPISEYLTYYGMNQERAAEIYAGLERDTEDARTKAKISAINEGKTEEEAQAIYDAYATQDNGWQHITWPFLSQTDPDAALEKFEANDTSLQTTDQANTYWFINSMKQYGTKSSDIVATGDLSASVYYNKSTGVYTANVWNPTNETKTVSFIKVSTGATLGTASVGAKALVKFEVNTDKVFNISQAATPTFTSKGLADGKTSSNISGQVEFDDTQIVELATATSGATIYYTTDGSVPTTSSNVYTGKIMVSSDTVIKAIAVKDGYIDSAYASLSVTVNGDDISSTDNLALGKTVTASSQSTVNSASNVTDGSTSSRWESDFDDDQWIYVDLGAIYNVNSVVLNWETAYASKCEIQVSNDAVNWTSVATVTNNKSGEKQTSFPAVSARYVKMLGLSRATAYGYSIYEFQVYGAVKASAPTVTPGSGTYTGSTTVNMSTSVKGAEIKYTLDGTNPDENSTSYTEPFTVNKSTIIKAVTYRKGMTLSDVVTSQIIISGTIAISSSEATVAVGNSKTLTAISDKSVTWSSSNTSVAKVVNGVVTGIKEGTAVITVSNGSDSASCTVTVVKAVPITSVTVSESALTLKVKDTATLTANYAPENTTDDTSITWTSSNPSVVAVDNGNITAKMEGTATITATIAGKSASCSVTVEPKYTTAEKMVSTEYNAMLSAKLYQSGKFEGSLSNLIDKVGFLGSAGGNWASQTVESGCGDLFIIADLADSYALNQIEALHIEWKNNDQTLPTDGFKILVCDDDNYNTTVDTDGETVTADNSNWTVVFDSAKNDATNSAGQTYDWVTDEVGCYSVLPLANSSYGKKFNHIKIEFEYNSARKPWGIQAYELALLTNDEEANTDVKEDETSTEKVTETTTEEVTTEAVEKPVTPFGIVADSSVAGQITVTMGNPGNGQTYNIYLDGEFVENVPLGSHILSDISAGTHTVKITGVLNGYESAGAEVSVTVEGASIKIDGFQVSTTQGGIRTVYSVNSTINNQKVIERGLIYGLEGYNSKDEMVIGSTSAYVHSYAASTAGQCSSALNDGIDGSYVMTMRFVGQVNATGLSTNYYVRAYAKLADGTYVYTNVNTFSAYAVANDVYQNKSSYVSTEGLTYLYNNILSVVNKDYVK